LATTSAAGIVAIGTGLSVSGGTVTANVQSVAGRTGAVTLSTSDVSGYVAPAVTSVAGRTGAVTLTTADISGYTAPSVTSVAGRTGAVTIAAADVSGLAAVATSGSASDLTGTLADARLSDRVNSILTLSQWSSAR
jgi:hypothetical protein